MKQVQQLRWTKTIVLIIFLTLITKTSTAQNNFEVYGGVGVMEAYHIGGSYQMDHLSFGASLGYHTAYSENMYSIAANAYYYFAGSSKHTEKPVWFGRLTLNHITLRDSELLGRALYLSPRLGREFNFSPCCGLRADIGFNYMVYDKTIDNVDKTIDFDSDILPAFSIVFFYRF